jgi:hypothetical protein
MTTANEPPAPVMGYLARRWTIYTQSVKDCKSIVVNMATEGNLEVIFEILSSYKTCKKDYFCKK